MPIPWMFSHEQAHHYIELPLEFFSLCLLVASLCDTISDNIRFHTNTSIENSSSKSQNA